VTRRSKIALFTGIAIAGAAVYWLASASRAFVENASYAVKRKDGDFEVREYPALAVASTAMQRPGDDGAFFRLFGYIDRGNSFGQKIAMTSPVLIDEQAGKMSFILPKEFQSANAPSARDEAVRIERRPAGLRAVYRFSGNGSDEAVTAALAKLRWWMDQQGLNPAGAPVIAFYDSPFIPPFLRRNEVMLPL
jgi:hypothetical protein